MTSYVATITVAALATAAASALAVTTVPHGAREAGSLPRPVASVASEVSVSVPQVQAAPAREQAPAVPLTAGGSEAIVDHTAAALKCANVLDASAEVAGEATAFRGTGDAAAVRACVLTAHPAATQYASGHAGVELYQSKYGAYVAVSIDGSTVAVVIREGNA